MFTALGISWLWRMVWIGGFTNGDQSLMSVKVMICDYGGVWCLSHSLCIFIFLFWAKLARKERWRRLWWPWWLYENGDERTVMHISFSKLKQQWAQYIWLMIQRDETQHTYILHIHKLYSSIEDETHQHVKPNTQTHHAHSNIHLFKIGVLTSCSSFPTALACHLCCSLPVALSFVFFPSFYCPLSLLFYSDFLNSFPPTSGRVIRLKSRWCLLLLQPPWAWQPDHHK